MSVGEPKVSVGMPVYNAELHVASAIRSVLEQSWPDLELVISDNASSDGTYDICCDFQRKDSRIRLVRQESNLGASANYGLVARLSRAPLFKWASANDLIHPRFLEACVAAMDAQPDCVLAYPRTLLFTDSIENGELYEDNLDLRMDEPVERFLAVLSRLRLNNVMNGLIRRAALARAGFMPDFANSDSLLVAELSLAGKFIEIPDIMFYRRMDPQSASKLKSNEELRRQYYPTAGLRMYWTGWRRQLGYFGAIRRASLTPRQRWRGMRYLAKSSFWGRKVLIADIKEAAAAVLRASRRD